MFNKHSMTITGEFISKDIRPSRTHSDSSDKQSISITDEKRTVSFPANVTSKPTNTNDVDGISGINAITDSQNNTSVQEIKTSKGLVRSFTSPIPQSPKRRPNSMTALTDDKSQNILQRSATTAGKSKKNTSALDELDANKKKDGKHRRNTINDKDIYEDIALDEETQKWAENVKRRLSKRRTRDKDRDDIDDGVMVGTRIGEDHVNYVLMYNMLTGIRVGVSRCNAKIQKGVIDADFKAAHKFSFDITGNELTPSAKYDFKFKDYAPWVFRSLREFFHIDAADYLVSLTSKYILSELGSPGKSGSFFYFSRDYRFIIKTIHHTEHKFLRKVLKEYYEHIRNNPDTLLSRFYGLHRVKLPRGPKIHFVVMNNIFPPHRDIHETYDLKGSTVGREYDEAEATKNPRAVLKDLNWIKRGRHLELGPEKRKLFVEQLEKDVSLLQRLNIMDYSLLVGLHDTSRGNKDKVREDFFVFQPDTKKIKRTPSSHKRESKASKLRKAVGETEPSKLDPSTTKLVLDAHNERRKCIFNMDDGGFAGTDEQNNPTNYIYYLGVIDILTPYNTVKKVEHAWKSLKDDKLMISAVHPRWYGKRFLDFMFKTIKHNDYVSTKQIEAEAVGEKNPYDETIETEASTS
ncbi:2293_t:CDS:2 [Funneliformis mosseae]|uniref:1-phosphatidylinositol-4-phosphate 5-kinase n=1 Tax=Funneliformis mosseae TaxID=27381 RepID=A0A9N9C5X1_FUNMO|nr:2293_t:CDS:2 [Funneliformis mosseae]